MNKFENIYQDAALMRKFLLGEANEAERKELEKRLAECPDLKDRKSTRLNSSHWNKSRMPSSA